MNLTTERKLKFDRRLSNRPGWLTEQELQAELEALPDSAGKIYDPKEQEPSEQGQTPEVALPDTASHLPDG